MIIGYEITVKKLIYEMWITIQNNQVGQVFPRPDKLVPRVIRKYNYHNPLHMLFLMLKLNKISTLE